MTLTPGTYGYRINDGEYEVLATPDGLYIPSNHCYWLATPADNGRSSVMVAGVESVFAFDYDLENYSVRPVVCLKSDIPAKVSETGDYDFSLTK